MGIHFTINSDPVGQGRPRFTRTGHAYTPTKTRNFHALVKLAAQAAMKSQTTSGECMTGPVELSLAVYVRIPQSKSKKWRSEALRGFVWPTTKPDLSNVLKAVEDGLSGTVIMDDKQIVVIHVVKHYAESPRLEVIVTPCGFTKTTA